MADRTVRVVLTAATQAFDAAMQRASASAKSLDQELTKVNKIGGFNDLTKSAAALQPKLAEIAASVDKTTAVSNTAMGKLAQSARLQSDAWNTAGTALAGVGAAITGVNLLVAKTGVEYNTLQQKSRAALTTMLGSATEVNAQMDRLDEFARTSPFSKATFITAQQQMLAFGIEAEKVVPYLSAINEATAAAGGNNQTLSELAFIMAQISAAGKITAQDLMQFGQRGVNAAELIGSQMGKTGAQIRDDITKGTLGAGDALDALADGMQERFEGASAGVKDTMAGAFDRVKAAFRDLSADMMASAVNPEGGGWFVDATNGLADLLRTIEKLPQPAKTAVGAISGMTGALALAGGGVLLAVPKFVELHGAWKSLAEISPRTTSAITGLGKAAGIAALAVTGLMVTGELVEYFQSATASADDAAAAVTRFAKGTGNFDDLFKRLDGSGLTQSVHDLESAAKTLALIETNGARLFEGLDFSAAARLDEQFRNIDATIKGMDSEGAASIFAHLSEVLLGAGVTTERIIELFPEYSARVNQAAADAGLAALSNEDLINAMAGLNPVLVEAMGSMDGTAAAAGNAGVATRDFAAEAETAAEAAQTLSSDVRETLSSLNDYYAAAVAASDATIGVETAFQKAADAAKENGENLDITTEKGRENMAALNGIAGAAERQAQAMLAAGDSTEDIVAATQRARDKFIESAVAMGASSTEAEMLADKYGLIPELVLTRFQQPGMEMSQEEAQAYRVMLANLPPEVRTHIKTIPDLSGYYSVDQALNRISGRTVTAYVAMKQYGQAAIATGGRVGDVAAAYGLAGGGYVRGPGTTTSDEAVAVNLSRDEFVMRAWAASRIGAADLYYMNRTGQIPSRPQNLVQRSATTSTITNNRTTNSSPQITLNVSLPSLTGAAAAEELVREIDALIAQNGA